MKILLIDNYDSFTYNLYQYLGEVVLARSGKPDIDVVRNDAVTLQEIEEQKYERIVISPGPGEPGNKEYFGVCAEVLIDRSLNVPVLGVCLGLQGMGHYFGGKVVRAKEPMHGKASTITHDGKGVFAGLPQGLNVMRYHSLVVDRDTLPERLIVTATANDTGEIMGLRHAEHDIEGIQFHPESFATEGGKQMLENFLFPK